MTKTDLIQRIAQQHPDLKEADCRRLIDAFFNAMIDQLSQDGTIELRGFGSFAIKRYHERIVRNPRTGATTGKSDIFSVRFRTGRSLVALINST
ncbi:integration host factor subunit beta [Sphingomonas sp. H160509]|uniref:HU family DNA-binding protein n=1 Tax=Sphingomonas sp. H160509 TaxID=2955313 RepID=UPI002097DAD5|nr:integration host factor subunit beta [Sphingomonas sp. H160509]